MRIRRIHKASFIGNVQDKKYPTADSYYYDQNPWPLRPCYHSPRISLGIHHTSCEHRTKHCLPGVLSFFVSASWGQECFGV